MLSVLIIHIKKKFQLHKIWVEISFIFIRINLMSFLFIYIIYRYFILFRSFDIIQFHFSIIIIIDRYIHIRKHILYLLKKRAFYTIIFNERDAENLKIIYTMVI